MSEDLRGLVARLQVLEADHTPDGWPAVRMGDISALCTEVERLRSALLDVVVRAAEEGAWPLAQYAQGRLDGVEQQAVTEGVVGGVLVKRELFRFNSEIHWVNKAQSWFKNCGVSRHNWICLDARGRVCVSGREFEGYS